MSKSAEGLLATLAHRGVELQATDDRLRYRPMHAVTAELQTDLVRHKRELLALLHQMVVSPVRAGTWGRCASALLARVSDDSMRAELRDTFEERAAVCQYHGCLNEDDAERIAFVQLYKAVIRSRADDVEFDAKPVTSSAEDADQAPARPEQNAVEGGNP